MELIVESKKDFVSLLEKFDKTGRHLHNGLWTEKVVLIDQHSTFMRLQDTLFAESVPLLLASQISYPIVITAETPKDYLILDIKVTKTRDGLYTLLFEPTPMRPVKEFLIREYEIQLKTFIENLRKLFGAKVLEAIVKKRKISSSKKSDAKKRPLVKRAKSSRHSYGRRY